MADNPLNDPFTRGFDAIQSALSNWPALAPLVLPGNRINLRIVGEVPRKENQEDGDWPEQFLKIASFNADVLDASSTHVKFDAGYTLQISSGVLTVEVAARVWWETMRALYSVSPAGGPYLGIDICNRWTVNRASPVSLREYMGTEQWVTVLNIRLFFGMTRSAFMAYPAQTFTT